MITVVVPAASASRTSGQVSSSRNTVSGTWAGTSPVRHTTATSTHANRMFSSCHIMVNLLPVAGPGEGRDGAAVELEPAARDPMAMGDGLWAPTLTHRRRP